MNLHTLPKTSQRKAKIVGRGIGSGKGGHTTGRGSKGQKARERVKIWFEGTKNKKALIKRFPLLRGKNKQKVWNTKAVAVSIVLLGEWPAKTPVTNENLKMVGILKSGEEAKLVGSATLKHALTVKVPASAAARAAIEAAGGTMDEQNG